MGIKPPCPEESWSISALTANWTRFEMSDKNKGTPEDEALILSNIHAKGIFLKIIERDDTKA